MIVSMFVKVKDLEEQLTAAESATVPPASVDESATVPSAHSAPVEESAALVQELNETIETLQQESRYESEQTLLCIQKQSCFSHLFPRACVKKAGSVLGCDSQIIC